MTALPTQSKMWRSLGMICWLVSWLVARDARAEMELIFRETFATTGRLDEANPGTNLPLIRGIFHQRPGGPRLSGGSAASADLRPDLVTPLATSSLPPGSGDRVFLCGWYFFKSLQDHGARLLSITDAGGNPGPTITVQNHGLAAGIAYLDQTPFSGNVLNRWVFLGIAVSRESGQDGSVRFYSKFPGEPMQTWAGFDDGNIGLGGIAGVTMGVDTTNSGIRCRLGAPAVYRFENADFSDITYPGDLLEPETGLTWYCNPATGNDNNDGTAPDRAWATVAKINEESSHTGLFPADSWEEGDTLVIDTSGAPLDGKGQALTITTSGLNVRAAEGNEWIELKSHRSLPGNTWEPVGIPNVYTTTDTQLHIVVWEDDRFLHHPTGPDLASVATALSTTPGSFWTDGTRLYLHPFGSTDPRTDGKRYERSHFIEAGSAVALMAPHLHVRDLRAGKTCLARSTDNDPIGGYCLSFGVAPGRSIVGHCYFYYGSKHNVGIVQGEAGDDLLLEEVQCEQGSPYAGAGGQTLFVSFNHRPLDLGIIHRFHRCRTRSNAGLVGSTEGTMTSFYPVFYSHNLGTPGEPPQFSEIEFVDCDFGRGAVFGGAVKNVRISGSVVGAIFFDRDVLVERSRVLGPLAAAPEATVSARHSIFELSGMLTANPVSGRLDLQGCVFDGSGITSIQGGVAQASFFTRDGPLDLLFRNNVVILPAAPVGAHLFSLLRHTDTLSLSHNAYLLGGNGLVQAYDNGNGSSNPTLAAWQSLGFDAGSFACTDPRWQDYRPSPGSPLLDAGAVILPAEDFTGARFFRRNDIGAFEGPPSRFDEWQFAHFTSEELGDPHAGGPAGSLFPDGIPNLMKFALNLPARTPANGGIFRMDRNAGQRWIEFTRLHPGDELAWSLEESLDLKTWRDVPGAGFVAVETNPPTERVRVTLPAGIGFEGDRFFRLKVRQTDPP